MRCAENEDTRQPTPRQHRIDRRQRRSSSSAADCGARGAGSAFWRSGEAVEGAENRPRCSSASGFGYVHMRLRTYDTTSSARVGPTVELVEHLVSFCLWPYGVTRSLHAGLGECGRHLLYGTVGRFNIRTARQPHLVARRQDGGLLLPLTLRSSCAGASSTESRVPPPTSAPVRLDEQPPITEPTRRAGRRRHRGCRSARRL